MIVSIFLFTLLLVLLLVCIAVPTAFILEIVGWTWTGVPYVPLPREALQKLPEIFELTDDSIVYDLGCGDGKVLFALARHSRATFIGVEKAPLPFLIASTRKMLSGRKNVRIVYGDIYTVPIADATHVFTYLFAKVMDRLLPKMQKELKPGSLVISCDFIFKEKTFDKKIPVGGNPPHTLYVYRF